jgi:hypothetical protein
MAILFENKCVKLIDISDEVPYSLVSVWKGFFHHEDSDATSGCLKTIELINNAGFKIMISDHSDVEGASLEFLEWAEKAYFLKAVQAGLKAEIIIEATDLMGNIALEMAYNDKDSLKITQAGRLMTPKVLDLEEGKIRAFEILKNL